MLHISKYMTWVSRVSGTFAKLWDEYLSTLTGYSLHQEASFIIWNDWISLRNETATWKLSENCKCSVVSAITLYEWISCFHEEPLELVWVGTWIWIPLNLRIHIHHRSRSALYIFCKHDQLSPKARNERTKPVMSSSYIPVSAIAS